MMLESSLRLLPCRLCHGNFGDTGSKELPQRCHFTLNLVFPSTTEPINNKLSCFAGLMKERSRSEREGVVRVAQALLVRITRFRLSRGVTAFLSPLSFR